MFVSVFLCLRLYVSEILREHAHNKKPFPEQVVTTAVFNAGIMACARAGELEEGMCLLREMWGRDVPRDVQTYNTAIALCKQVGEWTRAVSGCVLVCTVPVITSKRCGLCFFFSCAHEVF